MGLSNGIGLTKARPKLGKPLRIPATSDILTEEHASRREKDSPPPPSSYFFFTAPQTNISEAFAPDKQKRKNGKTI